MFGEFMYGDSMYGGWIDSSVSADWPETGTIKTVEDDT